MFVWWNINDWISLSSWSLLSGLNGMLTASWKFWNGRRNLSSSRLWEERIFAKSKTQSEAKDKTNEASGREDLFLSTFANLQNRVCLCVLPAPLAPKNSKRQSPRQRTATTRKTKRKTQIGFFHNAFFYNQHWSWKRISSNFSKVTFWSFENDFVW